MKRKNDFYLYSVYMNCIYSLANTFKSLWYIYTFPFEKYFLYVFRKAKNTILPQDMNFAYEHKFATSHEIKKSPNGKYFAVMENKVVTLWDSITGKKINSFDELKRPDTMNFSNSGKLLAVKSESGKIVLYDMTEIKYLKSWLPAKSIGCEVRFSPDDKYIVSADWDGNIYTIDIENGEVVVLRDDLFDEYDTLKFDSETNEFIFGAEDHRLIWKYPFEKNEPVEQKHGYRFEEMAYNKANQCYAITALCLDKKLLIVDNEYKQILKKITVSNIKGRKARILNAAWSPDGKLLALVADTGECYDRSRVYTIQLMGYPSLRIFKEYKIPYAYFVEFTNDGKQLLIGGWKEGYCINIDNIEK